MEGLVETLLILIKPRGLMKNHIKNLIPLSLLLVVIITPLLYAPSTSEGSQKTITTEELNRQKLEAEIAKLKVETQKAQIDATKGIIDTATSYKVLLAAVIPFLIIGGIIYSASGKNCFGWAEKLYLGIEKYRAHKAIELANHNKCLQNCNTLGTSDLTCTAVTPELLAQQDAQIERYTKCLQNGNTLGTDTSTCNTVTPEGIAQQDAQIERYKKCKDNGNILGTDTSTCKAATATTLEQQAAQVARYNQCRTNEAIIGANSDYSCATISAEDLALQNEDVAAKKEQLTADAQSKVPLGTRIYNSLANSAGQTIITASTGFVVWLFTRFAAAPVAAGGRRQHRH